MIRFQQQRVTSPRRPPRRGTITLWLILLMPILVILLCVVVYIGQMWVGRVELENAMEAAALAAVKEWGDAGGSSTLGPRQVGTLFAASNTVQGYPVEIGLNFDETNHPNENASCEGNLVFGAITSLERPWIFNAGVAPSCGLGRILVDASSQGNLAADNAWGVSFRAADSDEINENLVIKQLIIDVDPDDQDVAHFDGPAILSDNQPVPAVRDNEQNSQPDNFGWYGTPPSVSPQVAPPVNQIFFSFANPSPSTGNPRRLVIDFKEFESDAGFSPGDRFRFGANVRIRTGNGRRFREGSGDEVGQIPARVIVYFELAGQALNPVDGFLFDSGGRRKDCLDDNHETDTLGHQHLVVHPDEILDLPCPPNASVRPDKNGQSRALIGDAHRPFAVRAQATVSVSSLCFRFCSTVFNAYEVSACATAMYDCETRRPRLIRVRPENFVCP